MYVLISIILFGILIAVHEFGHFITAKLSGVKVHEFAIGMGPKIFSKKSKKSFLMKIPLSKNSPWECRTIIPLPSKMVVLSSE